LELFYGDTVNVSVCPADFSRVGFDLYYKLEKEIDGKTVLVATAKTGMICYNYNLKKIAKVPEKFQVSLTNN
jgi:acyl-CoA thioesterase FadM